MDLQEGKVTFIHLHVEASESILHLTLPRFKVSFPIKSCNPKAWGENKKLVGGCSPTHSKTYAQVKLDHFLRDRGENVQHI